jgi:carbon-monoxide dehydrogenase large subunit
VIPQLELLPMLTGAARYVADLEHADALHAAFVRSPLAHASVRAVDTSAARATAGVVAVFSATDLGLPAVLGFETMNPSMARPPLSVDKVRFVGEAVAVVLAETLAAATDAAELVDVTYEPLAAAVHPELASAPDAPLLFADTASNTAFSQHVGVTEDDALAGADVVVRAYFEHQRLSASPMETNAVLVEPHADGTITLHASAQGVHTVRDAIARVLEMNPDDVRVVAPHVGGGFGAKYHVCNEFFVLAAAARAVGRPVRWIETRTEHLLGSSHGRGQLQHAAMGFTLDGTIVGVAAKLLGDGGAYPGLGAVMPNATGAMACGPYRIPRVSVHSMGVVTNTSPTIAYRGAGRPEAAVMLERLIDLGARELGIDAIELRRRNLLEVADFPYTTPTGLRYDSGDYRRALSVALEAIDFDGVRHQQQVRPASAPALGVGIAVYMDVTPFRLVTEYVEIVVEDAEGGPQATVVAGTCTHGQSHETTYGALVTRELGIPRERITLVDRDTALVPRGIGSASARSAQIAGSAVHEASVVVRELACERAADLLEAPAADIVFADASFSVRGVPTRRVEWHDVLMAGPVRHALDWTQNGSTFPYGVHAAVVEVDVETGEIQLVRFVAVDDCGRLIVPELVDGQQQGGAAQGIAAVLYEGIVYDPDGTPRTANLGDYLVPSAADLPTIETRRTETPSPLNPIGAKGIGQSGAIGAPGAVINAVLDALAPLGVRDINPPFTPERVWRALQEAPLASRPSA